MNKSKIAPPKIVLYIQPSVNNFYSGVYQILSKWYSKNLCKRGIFIIIYIGIFSDNWNTL